MFEKQSMAVSVRMSPQQHKRIQRAAALGGVTMSEFVLVAALESAILVAQEQSPGTP